MKTALIPLVKIGRNLAIILVVLLIIALLGMIKFSWEQSFRIVFGVFYVLFIPGYIWSYVFFNRKTEKQEDKKIAEHKNTGTKEQEDNTSEDKPLDVIERIVLSLALSIALSPLALFFLNKVGVKINFWNSFIVISCLVVIGAAIIVGKQLWKKNKL